MMSVISIIYEGFLHLVLCTALLIIGLFLFGDVLIKLVEMAHDSVQLVKRAIAFDKRIR